MGCSGSKASRIQNFHVLEKDVEQDELEQVTATYDEWIKRSLVHTVLDNDTTQMPGNVVIPFRCEPPRKVQRTDSTVRYADKDQTIIIFDWDDTLCPSTWVEWRTASGKQMVSKNARRCLEGLSIHVTHLLAQARALGEVVLVTNSNRPWVDMSCDALFPQLKRELEGIQVLYAKEYLTDEELLSYSKIKRNTESKRRAMQAAVSGFYSRYEGQSWKNVVSIGDAHYEHEAVRQVTKQAPHGAEGSKKCRAKVVKLLDSPSLDSLSFQLSMLERWLQKIVQADNDVVIDFGVITADAHARHTRRQGRSS